MVSCATSTEMPKSAEISRTATEGKADGNVALIVHRLTMAVSQQR